jgi:hypothetical protein
MNDTTLTIIGMIVAFLTASITPIIAEAVKSKTRLRNLETALYREMLYNFLTLRVLDMQDIPLEERVALINNDGLRIECYKHALQNELSLFYQLAESGTINILQGRIKQIIALATDIKSLSGEEKIQMRLKELARNSSIFQKVFATANFDGTLNNALVRSITSTREFNIIKSKAEEKE